MSENGCTGLCCAAFHIPYTITDLRRGVDPKTGNLLNQAEQIAAMVIPLTPKQARERYVEFGGDLDDASFPWSSRGHHFTCRRWDEDTRLCTIYEDRPEMCRGYPYGEPCAHGCDCVGEPGRVSAASE